MTRSLALVNDPAAPRSVIGDIDARSCDFKRNLKKFSTPPILSCPRSRTACSSWSARRSSTFPPARSDSQNCSRPRLSLIEEAQAQFACIDGGMILRGIDICCGVRRAPGRDLRCSIGAGPQRITSRSAAMT